jgi:hypothetical protein
MELDVPVFAVCLTPSDSWEVLAPAIRELSGRHGVRRIARVSERSLRLRRQPSRRGPPLLRPPQRRVRRVA